MRETVYLATVLFLVAISPRFAQVGTRRALVGPSMIILVVASSGW